MAGSSVAIGAAVPGTLLLLPYSHIGLLVIVSIEKLNNGVVFVFATVLRRR